MQRASCPSGSLERYPATLPDRGRIQFDALLGRNDEGLTTSVEVDLEPIDAPSLVAYLLRRPGARISGVILADLDLKGDDDGGEELKVPKVSPRELAQMQVQAGVS